MFLILKEVRFDNNDKVKNLCLKKPKKMQKTRDDPITLAHNNPGSPNSNFEKNIYYYALISNLYVK